MNKHVTATISSSEMRANQTEDNWWHVMTDLFVVVGDELRLCLCEVKMCALFFWFRRIDNAAPTFNSTHYLRISRSFVFVSCDRSGRIFTIFRTSDNLTSDFPSRIADRGSVASRNLIQFCHWVRISSHLISPMKWNSFNALSSRDQITSLKKKICEAERNKRDRHSKL